MRNWDMTPELFVQHRAASKGFVFLLYDITNLRCVPLIEKKLDRWMLSPRFLS